jgi:quercetin dioxygenase-like cupin family protein
MKKIKKEWGKEKLIANTIRYSAKLLYFDKGKRCAMHFHKEKDATFYLLEGVVLAEVWGEKKEQRKLKKSLRIKPLQPHRFNALEDSVIIETSTTNNDRDSYQIQGMLGGDIPEKLFEDYLENYS